MRPDWVDGIEAALPGAVCCGSLDKEGESHWFDLKGPSDIKGQDVMKRLQETFKVVRMYRYPMSHLKLDLSSKFLYATQDQDHRISALIVDRASSDQKVWEILALANPAS